MSRSSGSPGTPHLFLAVACVLVLALPGASTAQTAAAAPIDLFASPDSSMAAILSQLEGEPLVLVDAIAIAQQQATAARIAEAELRAAQSALSSEKGYFDPELFGEVQWSGADTPAASLFAGADVLVTEQQDLQAGVRMSLRYGTELSASLNTAKLTTNSAFASLSPQYETQGLFSVRQPLLKGAGPSAAGDLKFAERNFEAASASFEGTKLSVRAAVEVLYWELYTAERNYAVVRLIRGRAVAFLEETRSRARAGLVGPSQVASARVFLAEQEQNVLDLEEALDRDSDRLATLLGRRPVAGLVRFRALDEPPSDFPVVEQQRLVETALEHNQELLAIAKGVDAVRVRERSASRDVLPTLDVFGSLGGAGLSGTPQDVYFPGSPDPLRTTVSGGMSDSWSQAIKRDYPNWNLGFVFALPVGGRSDKGDRDRLRAEVVRAEQMYEAARRVLEEQVRAQYRELVRGKQRLEIATAGVEASDEQVRIGLLEYRNGRTTAFEVVRLAADLAAAQQRYSLAMVRTARAAAELRRLTANQYPDHFH